MVKLSSRAMAKVGSRKTGLPLHPMFLELSVERGRPSGCWLTGTNLSHRPRSLLPFAVECAVKSIDLGRSSRNGHVVDFA
jgi:hypothetical protein